MSDTLQDNNKPDQEEQLQASMLLQEDLEPSNHTPSFQPASHLIIYKEEEK